MSEDKFTQTDHQEKDIEQKMIETNPPLEENTDEKQSGDHATTTQRKDKKTIVNKSLRILCSFGFIVFTALFINEVFLSPYLVNKSMKRTKELYNNSQEVTQANISPVIETPTITIPADAHSTTPNESEANAIVDPNRDEQGRLLKFQDLLKINEDVKGWISIPDTNIDYVVMQSSNEDPEYYLTRDIDKKVLKAGSLFLDYKSSAETPSQNIVIHGHNMTSSDNMFHYLLNFKEIDYYKERPVFTFDTIYNTGEWKIFSIFITNGSSTKEPLFNYTRSNFNSTSDFLNFVYQLRIRSIYIMDTVDINENDQILTLSTCSYEVKNYRTVIVARKIREGEDSLVDVGSVTINPAPLYPSTYYYRMGGEAPELSETFEEALKNGDIGWYRP